MTDEAKTELLELTPEQKATMETVKGSISKFNQMVSFYLFNQLQMIEAGEIHIHLVVKDRKIDTVDLHSQLSRRMNSDGKKD